MKRELVFSARYTTSYTPAAGEESPPDPEKWVPDFLNGEVDRAVLSHRLLKLARAISAAQAIDMDIFHSPDHVRIDVFLDYAIYFESQLQQLSALLFVCNSMCVTYPTDRQQICLSLHYDRSPL